MEKITEISKQIGLTKEQTRLKIIEMFKKREDVIFKRIESLKEDLENGKTPFLNIDKILNDKKHLEDMIGENKKGDIMKQSYGCLITKEGNTYVGVFPDLNYTTSWGETFKEAIYKLKEAGELYCDGLEELPLKTSIDELCEKYNHKGLAVGIVLNVNNLSFEESQKEAFECLNDLDKFNKLQDA